MHGGLQMTNGTPTLTDALFQEAYICASDGNTSRDYNSRPQGPNFHAELLPVHSPLLRESYLVSYPPLTYMLKFSGFADLTSCLDERMDDQADNCRKQEGTHKVLFQLLATDTTRQLNVSKARSSLTHKHAHMTAPK